MYEITCYRRDGSGLIGAQVSRGTLSECQHAVRRHLMSCHQMPARLARGTAYALTEEGGRLTWQGVTRIEVRVTPW